MSKAASPTFSLEMDIVSESLSVLLLWGEHDKVTVVDDKMMDNKMTDDKTMDKSSMDKSINYIKVGTNYLINYKIKTIVMTTMMMMMKKKKMLIIFR